MSDTRRVYSPPMQRPTKRTKRAPASDMDYLDGVCLASAGPWANVTGMKNLYWGVDACCVSCGQYLYKVKEEVYERY